MTELKTEYPKLATVLGETGFRNLITDYLEVYPPAGGGVGAHLPEFLRDVQGAPIWLADLAELEWARVAVFDESDAETFSPSALLGLPAAAVAPLALRLVPAHRRITVATAVHEVWQKIDRAEPFAPAAVAPHDFLVWRNARGVFHRSLTLLEVDALDQIDAGGPFGRVFDLLHAVFGDEQQAALRSYRMLHRWSTDGIVQLAA